MFSSERVCSDVNDIICFDIWLMIAELNAETFRLVRSINRLVRDYTNTRIDIYMDLFTIKYTTGSFFAPSYWSILPNGYMHGQNIKIKCERYFYGFSEETITATYKKGKLCGPIEKKVCHPFFVNHVIANYDNNILDGTYTQINSSHGYVTKIEANYKNGLLEGEYREYFGDYLVFHVNYKNNMVSSPMEVDDLDDHRYVKIGSKFIPEFEPILVSDADFGFGFAEKSIGVLPKNQPENERKTKKMNKRINKRTNKRTNEIKEKEKFQSRRAIYPKNYKRSYH